MRTQRRTKAVGYVRVSSEQQATEGVSLDAQRYKMRAYCKAMDVDLIDDIADEGYSASNLKRPSHRSHAGYINWANMSKLLEQFPLPQPRLVHPCRGEAPRALSWRGPVLVLQEGAPAAGSEPRFPSPAARIHVT